MVAETRFHSSLGIKYPTLRDSRLRTGLTWLQGKKADDGAEGLWRVHDKLYDFTKFINQHPGGSDWLDLTKGTDISEAFESHHLSSIPEQMLEKYYIRTTKVPRNSPFTFKKDGFYMTLKKKIKQEVDKLPKEPVLKSKKIIDFILLAYITSVACAAYTKSFALGISSGFFLCILAVAAHNFFHQKDNFRMYYFNLSLLEYREWRISHALSHHLHTNTINDLEISALEPFLEYLPGKKSIIHRLVTIIISPGVYALLFFGSFIRSLIQTFVLRTQKFSYLIFLPFSIVALLLMVSLGDFKFSMLLFLWIQATASFFFGVIGVNAAHHHPDIFHDGDAPRAKHELDWGIYQLDAVMDRKDISGSHFLVLTSFGDHALHHLFPTIDHGLLEYLYPTFLRVCTEFGVQWKLGTQMQLVKGQIQQLAKAEPNKEPPRSLLRLNII